MNHKTAILGATVLLALGACTQSQWVKPNAAPDVAAADLNECRQLARQETMRQAERYGFYADAPISRFGYGDALWRADYDRWSADQRFTWQNRLIGFCMHSKGYERVPGQAS